MSKALEALRNIQANTYYVDKHGNEQHVYPPDDAQFELIRKTLTPPTADEVCEALSEYLGEIIIFNSGSFMNERGTAEVCAIGGLGLVHFNKHLPPHLVTLIGRFYEGVQHD